MVNSVRLWPSVFAIRKGGGLAWPCGKGQRSGAVAACPDAWWITLGGPSAPPMKRGGSLARGIRSKAEVPVSSSSPGRSLVIHGASAINGVSVVRYFCAPLIFSQFPSCSPGFSNSCYAKGFASFRPLLDVGGKGLWPGADALLPAFWHPDSWSGALCGEANPFVS